MSASMRASDGSNENGGTKRGKHILRKHILMGVAILICVLVITSIIRRGPWDDLWAPSTHETEEVTAFLTDPVANEDDLRVFDTLRPAIDAVISKDEAQMWPTRDIRRSIMDGHWEGITSAPSLSPLLWTRICELSERDMKEKTGENWEVIDFTYAFPIAYDSSGGVIHRKVQGERDEDSCIEITLACASGSHEGMVVHNNYLRWAPEPHFQDDYVKAIERYYQMGDCLQTLHEIVPNNDILLVGDATRYDSDNTQGYDAYIWEREDEKELADSTRFAEMAQEIFDSPIKVSMVATLGHGEPFPMQTDEDSYKNFDLYPIPQEQPSDTTPELCRLDSRISFDSDSYDAIHLRAENYNMEDGKVTVESIDGSRVSKPVTRKGPLCIEMA